MSARSSTPWSGSEYCVDDSDGEDEDEDEDEDEEEERDEWEVEEPEEEPEEEEGGVTVVKTALLDPERMDDRSAWSDLS